MYVSPLSKIPLLIGYQTGALTAQLNDGPQKISGLAGVSLSAYAFFLFGVFFFNADLQIASSDP